MDSREDDLSALAHAREVVAYLERKVASSEPPPRPEPPRSPVRLIRSGGAKRRVS